MPANNTIWVIGDSLLTDASGHYNQFKKRKGEQLNSSTEAQLLYIENMYAIRIISPGVCTSKQAKNMPNIVLNSLVETLNMKAKVPHTIVILVNDHRFWNDTNILNLQMERILARFFREFWRIIEARNLSLPPKAVNWEYPRLFITKALPLPNHMTKQYPKAFKPNRRKYNKILLRGEEEHKYRTINLSDFTCENSNKLFNPDGTISHAGYRNIWRSISDAVHKADNQNRILLNKARAKQLSQTISVTNTEINQLNTVHNEDMLSDVESLPDSPQVRAAAKVNSPIAKRALAREFDKINHGKHRRIQDTSPSSTISEYYTTGSKNMLHQGKQHYHHMGGIGHKSNKYKGNKRHQFKHNWRLHQWNN